MIIINERYVDKVEDFFRKNGYEKQSDSFEEFYTKNYSIKGINWGDEIAGFFLTHSVSYHKVKNRFGVEVHLFATTSDGKTVFHTEDKELSNLLGKVMEFLSKKLGMFNDTPFKTSRKISNSIIILKPKSCFGVTDKEGIDKYIYKVSKEIPKLLPQIKNVLKVKPKGRI